jgi:hypothetical protein
MTVIPSAVLQPGASHRQSARGLESLIPAHSTVYESMLRTTITESEVLSRHSEILQLCVFRYGIVIIILQRRYQKS